MAAGRGQEKVSGLSVDDAIRTLLLLTPRMVNRIRRIPIPAELQSLALAPRHLSLLAYLVFDGPMTVSELAARLEVQPATVSLMISQLNRKGILRRMDDDADRRRTIVSIADEHRPAIDGWLTPGATAWRRALEPLTDAERKMFLDTLSTFDQEVSATVSPGA